MKFIKLISFSFLFIIFASQLSAAPIVSAVTPTHGPISGGNVITIIGSGFTGTTSIDFGTRPAPSFNVITDSSISVSVPVGTAGTVDIRVTAAGQVSDITRADLYTYTQNSWNGILSGTNQDAITLFDTATNTINGQIFLPADSLAAIITPDGTTIYATDSDQAQVNVIDAATNTIITNISTPVAGTGSFDMIVSPDGKRVYISNLNSGFVTVIDTTTNTVLIDIFVAPGLGPLSITPDGKTVYVANFLLGNVTTISTETFTVGVSIPTGITPGMISITPNGTTAYVANAGSDTVTVIDVATNIVLTNVIFPANSGPYGSAILPDGMTMYVANINNATVSIVDIPTNSITGTMSIVGTIPFVPGSRPFWVVSTPDGKTVYVINQSTDDVTPIDVATNTVGPSFAMLDGDIQDIVMSPDPAPVSSFFVTGNTTSGLPTVFNASASISPIGTISTYAWDFGDGTFLTTDTPIITHTYLSAGTFNVVLTVTNSAGTSTSKVFSSRFMSNNGSSLAISSQTVNIFPAPVIFPPRDLRGFQTTNRFATQTDIVNILTWKAPVEGDSPAAYYIYRNANLTDLVAKIPANQKLIFKDHNRKKGKRYTYFIVSVSKTGVASLATTITIPK